MAPTHSLLVIVHDPEWAEKYLNSKSVCNPGTLASERGLTLPAAAGNMWQFRNPKIQKAWCKNRGTHHGICALHEDAVKEDSQQFSEPFPDFLICIAS